jgi:hypothetical protein
MDSPISTLKVHGHLSSLTLERAAHGVIDSQKIDGALVHEDKAIGRLFSNLKEEGLAGGFATFLSNFGKLNIAVNRIIKQKV